MTAGRGHEAVPASAPTEAEIRELVDGLLAEGAGLNAAGRLSDAFGECYFLTEMYADDDLRPSEQRAIDAYTEEAMRPILTRTVADLKEALVTAGLRFGADYPNAPRRIPKLAATD